MKEILFDFGEFKSRSAGLRNGNRPAHYAFRRNVSGGRLFVAIEFRIYCRDSDDCVLIFEKSAVHEVYEEDAIKAFSEDCRKLAAEVGATPGYLEEGDA